MRPPTYISRLVSVKKTLKMKFFVKILDKFSPYSADYFLIYHE